MRKSQGEIFGIALLFVVLILGLIIYSQVSSGEESQAEKLARQKYSMLATGTTNSLFTLSTGCEVERGKDSLKHLINYCLAFSSTPSDDPEIQCNIGGSTQTKDSCSYAKTLLNDSLQKFFNHSETTMIPYEMKGRMDSFSSHSLGNFTLTNFGSVKRNGQTINESNYLSLGFRRATSGLKTWSTNYRNIKFQLYLYYRP